MENKGVIFGKDTDKPQINLFTITIQGDYNDYLETIKSLLSVLGVLGEDVCYESDRLHICHLITHMLPSSTQMRILSDIQSKATKS